MMLLPSHFLHLTILFVGMLLVLVCSGCEHSTLCTYSDTTAVATQYEEVSPESIKPFTCIGLCFMDADCVGVAQNDSQSSCHLLTASGADWPRVQNQTGSTVWRLNAAPTLCPIVMGDGDRCSSPTLGNLAFSTAWSDQSRAQWNGPVSGIRAWRDNFIESIQFRYGRVWGPTYPAVTPFAPPDEEILLEDGEFFTSFEADYGDILHGMVFQTTLQRSLQIGISHSQNTGLVVGGGYILYFSGTHGYYGYGDSMHRVGTVNTYFNECN